VKRESGKSFYFGKSSVWLISFVPMENWAGLDFRMSVFHVEYWQKYGRKCKKVFISEKVFIVRWWKVYNFLLILSFLITIRALLGFKTSGANVDLNVRAGFRKSFHLEKCFYSAQTKRFFSNWTYSYEEKSLITPCGILPCVTLLGTWEKITVVVHWGAPENIMEKT
jgi:hypothetical protein